MLSYQIGGDDTTDGPSVGMVFARCWVMFTLDDWRKEFSQRCE